MSKVDEIKQEIAVLQEKLKEMSKGISQLEVLNSNDDYYDLRYACEQYVNAVMHSDNKDLDDEEHAIFEEALRLVYGNNIFEKLRKYWE